MTYGNCRLSFNSKSLFFGVERIPMWDSEQPKYVGGTIHTDGLVGSNEHESPAAKIRLNALRSCETWSSRVQSEGLDERA